MPMPIKNQDPHRVSAPRERNLERAIGRAVRACRSDRQLTVKELSAATGLSIGMLSKIENGVTSPSLTTLEALAQALGVPITRFFQDYEHRRAAVHTRAGDGVEMTRAGTRAGHQYRLLGHIDDASSGVVVEPYLITLTDASDSFPAFQHEGVETIYMLEGGVTYRHGEALYDLRPGDTLFFDADAPHGPEALTDLPVRFLSIIAYPAPTA